MIASVAATATEALFLRPQEKIYMPRNIIALICILFLTCLPAQSETTENLIIKTIILPFSTTDNHVYAVAGNNGVRAWGFQHRIFIERSNNETMEFSPANSPLAEEGTISDIGIVNEDIWVAQTAPSKDLGILKFDGSKWEKFREPDAVGLLNNEVVDIHIDPDENIWFGHRYHGLSRLVYLVNPTFKSYNKVLHLFENALQSSFMQKTHLWIGTANGIVRLRTELKSNFELNVDTWLYPEFPAREAFSVCDYVDDMVVAGTSRGIALFDGKKWSLRGRTEGIKALPVNFLQRDGDRVWLGSPVGLQLWSINEPGQLITEADGLPGSNITALAIDENGNLLVGTDKGPALIRKK